MLLSHGGSADSGRVQTRRGALSQEQWFDSLLDTPASVAPQRCVTISNWVVTEQWEHSLVSDVGCPDRTLLLLGAFVIFVEIRNVRPLQTSALMSGVKNNSL